MTGKGQIFAIKKYAIHDGPNIRTTVFFKGCPLGCVWCHNPEGILPGLGRLLQKNLCIGCGQCVDECGANALTLTKDGIFRNSEKCNGCGHCVDICPALAHEAVGRSVDISEVMEQIKKDIPFYDQSGGGVTFSGGDPLFQPAFLFKLLIACKSMGLHCAVDTCLYAKQAHLEKIANLTDLFLVDIKHMDSAMHEKFTGRPNDLILDNIRFLAASNANIRFRIPLIEGVNTDSANIDKTGRFIAGIRPGSRVDLLPFHDMAEAKYEKLGMPLPNCKLSRPAEKKTAHCATLLEAHGLHTTIGG